MKVKEFSELAEGMEYSKNFTFSEELVLTFAALVDDFAPVHVEEDFALDQGFDGRIVHGLFVTSIFSGILGSQIPGPKSVINSLNVKMHNPVLLEDEIFYNVVVSALTPAVKAVVLNLKAENPRSGSTILSGKSICSFPGE